MFIFNTHRKLSITGKVVSVLIALKCIGVLGAHAFYGLSLMSDSIVYYILMDSLTVMVILCGILMVHFLMFFTYSDTIVAKLLAGTEETNDVPQEVNN